MLRRFANYVGIFLDRKERIFRTDYRTIYRHLLDVGLASALNTSVRGSNVARSFYIVLSGLNESTEHFVRSTYKQLMRNVQGLKIWENFGL